MPRPLLAALTALTALLGSLMLVAPPAAGGTQDGYRYWNYSHLGQDGWTFAAQGPADFVPEDGAMEGFRYGTSTEAQGITPRADLSELDFAAVCAGSDATEEQKRVAILVDFGVEDETGPSPEPRGFCAVVPEDASTLTALDEVGGTRVENGLVCGIGGYPTTGCGEAVKDAVVPEDEQPVAFALPPAAQDGAGQNTGQGAVDEDVTGADTDADGGGLLWPLLAVAVILVLLVIVVGRAALRRRRTDL